MANARLQVLNTELGGREFALPDHPVIVGRSSSSDIVVPHQSVSRQHVRAEVRDGSCLLTDLGSQNGIVVRGETVREAVVSNGDEFELGDVALRFLADSAVRAMPGEAEAAPTAPVASYAPVPAAAAPVSPTGERPVFVDEVFGPAATPEAAGPGEEEKAAVEGARNIAKYVALIVVVLLVGAFAWQLASSHMKVEQIKPVIVKAGEVKAIDLGLAVRQAGGKVTEYIDDGEVYEALVYPPDAGARAVAICELDRTGFIATVEGRYPGEMDVLLLGPGKRKAILRVLVRGAVPRPPDDERLSAEDRIARATLLITAGEAARKTNYLYLAQTKFKQARALLEPVKTPEGIALSRQADQLYMEMKNVIDQEFERIKFRALARYYDRDTVGAAKEFEKLCNLIPDPDDPMNQKMKIIFDRTVREID